VIAGATATTAGEARAEDAKRACVEAHEEAQRLRIAGDLLAARDELRACSGEACPGLVQRDCVGWLREVEAAIPSVIVSARDPAGMDRSDVRVFVDGKLALGSLKGEALEIRPGERQLRFEAAGAAAVEQRVLINTGEKNRLIRVVIGAPRAEASGAAVSRPGPPILPIALGVAGLVAVGSGIALDLSGSAGLSDLRATCAPRCAEADVDATRTKIIVGDTLLGVGVVAIGAAVFLWLTHDDSTPAPEAAPRSAEAPRLAPFRITY